jgi:long-chain acyl-CoA synthetase
MLTHGNLLYQINNLSHFLAVEHGQSALSLLPPWHIYERTCGWVGVGGVGSA